MKVKELIEQLNDLPKERKDEEIKIYITGDLTGFLKIRGIDASSSTLSIDSVRTDTHQT